MAVNNRLRLKVWDGLQEDIQNILKLYPRTIGYYKYVAEKLKCDVTELVALSTIEDNCEGWEISDFFPKDKGILITDDTAAPTEIGDFSFGLLRRVTYDGVVFYAETNTSPYLIYANPKTFDVLTDEPEEEELDDAHHYAVDCL